jgi:hypothetical protein
MKYLFKRSARNTYYYKRRVPKGLQEHYPKPFIEISLRQTDRSIAAAVCQEAHRLIEEQFNRLRQGLPRDQVISNYQAATALFKKHGLTESNAKATGDGADEAKGESRLKASQPPAEYLRLKNKDSGRKNVNEANNAMNALIACCEDKPPADYPRSDINLFINQSLKKKKNHGTSTTQVHSGYVYREMPRSNRPQTEDEILTSYAVRALNSAEYVLRN